MTEIVINKCYGGFSLSEDGMKRYAEIKGIPLYIEQGDECSFKFYYTMAPERRTYKNDGYLSNSDIERDDPALIQTVRELGPRADGSCASLRIIDIPDGVEWEMKEYDGLEWVAEKHRTWG